MHKIKKYLKLEFATYYLCLLIIAVPIFINLDVLPLRLWDEGLVSLNAQEMYFDHDFIVTHSNGKPEMWNTKPPFLIWLQVLSMTIFGVNDLAVRLPSAFAGFITCLILIWFGKRLFKDAWYGIIASFVLVTSTGYIVEHAVRSSDYDSMLCLFTTSTLVFYYMYLVENNNRFLKWMFVFFTLGILTKSISIFMIVPGLFIGTMYMKKLKMVVANKRFYLYAIFSLSAAISYFLIRERFNPGYLKAVWENDIGGRYLTVIEDHKESFWFYYDKITQGSFNYFYLLIPISFFLALNSLDSAKKKAIIFMIIYAVSFWFILSKAQTKLFWYLTPIYPIISFIVAYPIEIIFRFFSSQNIFEVKQRAVGYVFLFLVFLFPYKSIIASVYQVKDFNVYMEFEGINYYIKQNIKNETSLDGYVYVNDNYNNHIQFYVNILKFKNQTLFKINKEKLFPNQKVIASFESDKNFIREKYETREIYQDDCVTVFEILNRK